MMKLSVLEIVTIQDSVKKVAKVVYEHVQVMRAREERKESPTLSNEINVLTNAIGHLEEHVHKLLRCEVTVKG